MRKIKYIVVHCTATQPHASIAAIKRYWREELKWQSPGYHYIIDAFGTAHHIHPESLPSNGVAGYNTPSIHVAYIGGIDKAGRPFDSRTIYQKQALEELLQHLKRRYPEAVIQGHRDFPAVKKACPSFEAKAEYRHIG